jgi:hypothetical protein
MVRLARFLTSWNVLEKLHDTDATCPL